MMNVAKQTFAFLFSVYCVIGLAGAQEPEPFDIEELSDEQRRGAAIQLLNGAIEVFAKLDEEAQTDAYILTLEAIRLFPEQNSIEEFDPELAWAMLYQTYLAHELGLSDEEAQPERFEGRTARGVTLGPSEPVFRPGSDNQCVDVEWRRKPPVRNFGWAVFRNGGFVGSVVGMNLSDRGRPVGSRVIGMFPEDNQHVRTVTERAVKRWRADRDSIPETGCTNFLVLINYRAGFGPEFEN